MDRLRLTAFPGESFRRGLASARSKPSVGVHHMTTLVQPTPLKIGTPSLPQGDSCLVVIFGGSGDLTRRKLIPALYDLACVGCTNRNFEVLGIGRSKFDDEEYR